MPPAKHRHTEPSPTPGATLLSSPPLGSGRAAGKPGCGRAVVTVTVTVTTHPTGRPHPAPWQGARRWHGQQQRQQRPQELLG